ncbi:MAG: hypothetical protein KIT62_00575 [Cyclobacteriaceae bacterium]|nr:hypothetical protein [Cyclobacteriaceae bacterium]
MMQARRPAATRVSRCEDRKIRCASIIPTLKKRVIVRTMLNIRYFWGGLKMYYFILALYIAALSVYPCYDGTCAGERATETVAHDEGEPEPESCSPFCASACCALRVYPAALQLTVFVLPAEANPGFYTDPFIATVIQSIWQPPRWVK